MDLGRISKELDPEAWLAAEITGDRGTDDWLDSAFVPLVMSYRRYFSFENADGRINGWLKFEKKPRAPRDWRGFACLVYAGSAVGELYFQGSDA